MHITNSDTDEEIVEKIKETRDPILFEVLYERHVHKIYNKCLGFAANSQTAEDLTHDVFLKAYLSIKSYQGKSKFYTWLYSLCYNYCVDYYNTKKKNRDKLDAYLQDTSLQHTDDEPSDAQLFEIKIERLKIVMDKISPDDKVILLMKYQDDFTIEDIAESLGLGSSAVKMRIKRAKIKVIETYQSLYNSRRGQNM